MPYYWRLSSFYFLYFAAVGALLPYWTLYLNELGYSEYQIGLFMGLTTLIKIVAPNIWGWIADRSGRPIRIVRVGALVTACAMCGLFFGSQFVWLALVMTTAHFFSAAMLPQIEAFSMRELKSQRDRYGRIRLWGSVGFIIAVVAAGALVDIKGVGVIITVVVAIHFGVFLLSLAFRDQGLSAEAPGHRSLSSTRWRPNVYTVLFIVAGLLMQASHGPFYTFFTIELASLGYSKTVIGMLWAFGVVCEVGIFLVMDRVFARFDVVSVLVASFVTAAVRWALLAAFGDSFAVLVMVQALHAVTFGAWHSASMKFIFHHFPGTAHHRGQALYGSLSFGLGTAVGSYFAGVAWSSSGAAASWQLASVAAALAALITLPILLSGDRWRVR